MRTPILARLGIAAVAAVAVIAGTGGMALAATPSGASHARAAHVAKDAAAGAAAVAVAKPLYSKDVTVKVRCGKFTGNVMWGGDGSILFPAYLDVHGTVSSSCNSTTTARISYTNGPFGNYGPTVFGTARAHKSATADFNAGSGDSTYGNISIQACTTDGMPAGKILCSTVKV